MNWCYIIPGTTPTVWYDRLDADLRECDEILFTIARGEEILIERHKDTICISDDRKTAYVTLTQKETLSLPNDDYVSAQLQILIGDLSAATVPEQIYVSRNINRKELVKHE